MLERRCLTRLPVPTHDCASSPVEKMKWSTQEGRELRPPRCVQGRRQPGLECAATPDQASKVLPWDLSRQRCRTRCLIFRARRLACVRQVQIICEDDPYVGRFERLF